MCVCMHKYARLREPGGPGGGGGGGGEGGGMLPQIPLV